MTSRDRTGPRSSTDTCPRTFTREQLIEGLKQGRAFYVDRSDAPELRDLLELERQGKCRSRLVEYDEQGSALKFWWAEEAQPPVEDASPCKQEK